MLRVAVILMLLIEYSINEAKTGMEYNEWRLK